MSEFSFFPVPPEVLEQIRRSQEHEHMHSQENTHSVKRLLDELGREQLETLDFILAQAVTPGISAYLRGQITMMLHLKHDVCSCGQKHDVEDLLASGDSDVKEEEEEEEEEEIDLTDNDTYLEQCDLYNVNPKRNGTGKVICLGCGKEYPSLQDRMLRQAGIEGCETCIQKMKWG